MSNETPPFRDHPAVRAVIGFGRAPDAVDAAIERHRAARDELQRATGGVDAASNADGAAWADLLATRPGDVQGAVRLLRYVSGSPASEVVEDPQDLLRQLLAAVEAGETGGTAGEGALVGAEHQAVAEPDPALAVVAEYRAAWDGLGEQVKTSWIGAAAEAADDAEAAAYARLRTVRPTTPAGFRALAETWAWRLAMTRNGAEADTVADNAADALIAGAGVCVPAALAETAEKPVDWHAPPPGFMASPAIEPFGFALIPEGIAIELDRLRGIALAEFERQSAAGMTSEGEERLRRGLHLDTLSKAARGEGAFSVWPAPSAEAADVRDGQANPRLCALVTAWEAAERAGNAPGLSDEERAPLIDHASGLLRDLYAFPARTMADICAKLPAFRDEAANTGDAPDAPDTEVTLEACALRGLVADLERLVAGRMTGPEHPDAELLRLIASAEVAQVRCDAAHTTWAEAEEAAAATRPGRPDELRRTNDFRHFWGMAANPHSPDFYTADEVAEFRQYEPAGHANAKAEAAARARAAEIVAAFWRWQAEIRAHDEACGVAALDRTHDEACDDYQTALNAVMSARPATLTGVLAKARVSLSEDTVEFDRILRDDLLAMAGSLT